MNWKRTWQLVSALIVLSLEVWTSTSRGWRGRIGAVAQAATTSRPRRNAQPEADRLGLLENEDYAELSGPGDQAQAPYLRGVYPNAKKISIATDAHRVIVLFRGHLFQSTPQALLPPHRSWDLLGIASRIRTPSARIIDLGSDPLEHFTPVVIPDDPEVIQLSLAGTEALALTRAGKLYAWEHPSTTPQRVIIPNNDPVTTLLQEVRAHPQGVAPFVQGQSGQTYVWGNFWFTNPLPLVSGASTSGVRASTVRGLEGIRVHAIANDDTSLITLPLGSNTLYVQYAHEQPSTLHSLPPLPGREIMTYNLLNNRYAYVLSRTSSGRTFVYGTDRHGALGLGPTHCVEEQTPLSFPEAQSARQIVGLSHTPQHESVQSIFAVTDQHRLYSWGADLNYYPYSPPASASWPIRERPTEIHLPQGDRVKKLLRAGPNTLFVLSQRGHIWYVRRPSHPPRAHRPNALRDFVFKPVWRNPQGQDVIVNSTAATWEDQPLLFWETQIPGAGRRAWVWSRHWAPSGWIEP